MRGSLILFLVCGVVSAARTEAEAPVESYGGTTKGSGQTNSSNSTVEKSRDISQFVKPEKPPPFFGIDIDGTFYAQDEEAMKRNVKAFAEVKKKGYIPFFCTGRSFRSSVQLFGDDFVDKTGYNGCPGVYNNGSSVYDCDGNIIFSSSFSREFLTTFYKFLTDKGIQNKCIFYTETSDYSIGELDSSCKSRLSHRRIALPGVKTADEILNMKIISLSVDCENYELGHFKENVDYLKRTSSAGLFNITPANVNKAFGLEKLMEHLQVKPEDFGYVGNAENDVEAMELCKVSFAVANAKDEVKKHAKWVLDKTCDEGAVAEALELTYGPFSSEETLDMENNEN